jgi:hypothetical protein
LLGDDAFRRNLDKSFNDLDKAAGALRMPAKFAAFAAMHRVSE